MSNTSFKHEAAPQIRVRDGLCRNVRAKGMISNVGEKPENDSGQRGYLAVDPHALGWDSTIWWCAETGKSVGPDDRPCNRDSCQPGRGCFEAEVG